MGNGPRVTIDIESSPLDIDDIEKAAAAAMANFGRPNIIMMPMAMMSHMGWEPYPEYSGTPWSSSGKLSKREKVVAGLHTTLQKLGALRNVDEEAFDEIRYKSIKRLKRAKWAQYQQKKTK